MGPSSWRRIPRWRRSAGATTPRPQRWRSSRPSTARFSRLTARVSSAAAAASATDAAGRVRRSRMGRRPASGFCYGSPRCDRRTERVRDERGADRAPERLRAGGTRRDAVAALRQGLAAGAGRTVRHGARDRTDQQSAPALVRRVWVAPPRLRSATAVGVRDRPPTSERLTQSAYD